MRKGHKKIIDKVNEWEKKNKTVIAPALKEVLYDTSYPVWFFEHIYEIITSSETDEEKLLHIQKVWFLLSNLPRKKENLVYVFTHTSYNRLKNVTLEDFEMFYCFGDYPSSVDIEELRLIYAYIQSLKVEPVTEDGIVYNTVQGTSPDTIAISVFEEICWFHDGSFTLDYMRPYCDYIIKTYGGPYNPNNTNITDRWGGYLDNCLNFFKNNICFEEAAKTKFSYTEFQINKLYSHFGIILDGLCGDGCKEFSTGMEYIYDDFIPEEYRESFELLKSCSGIDITADIPSCTFKYRLNDIGINLDFCYNSKVIIRKAYNNRDQIVYYKRSNSKLKLLLTHSGTILTKTNNRWHVVSIKQLSKYSITCQRAEFYDPNYLKFLNLLYEQLLNNQVYLVNDIWKSVKDGNFLVPITFDELINSHQKKQLMKKYKLPLNFNKADINLSYVVAKSIPYVDEKSANILLNYKDINMLHRAGITAYTDFSFRNIRKYYAGIKIFLTNYLYEQIATESAIKEYSKTYELESVDAENELRTLCNDYVNTQMAVKEKINLKIKSWKKLNEAHNETNRHINIEKFRKDKSIEVKVQKNSKYEDLRTLLPKNFEWIKDKKRLLLEAQLQHNCVFSYWSSINQDNCAIYSLWYEPENCRYTIQFVFHEGHYKISQMYRACNQGSTKTARSYVTGFLNNSVTDKHSA